MSKLSESDLFGQLKTYTNSRPHLVLVSLLESRLETLKNELIDCEDSEYRKVKGRAKEIQHLLSGLTRKALTKQYTGAFD